MPEANLHRVNAEECATQREPTAELDGRKLATVLFRNGRAEQWIATISKTFININL